MRKLILILCFCSASIAAGQFPAVIDPVINATPPGAKVAAGYFSMMNDSDTTFTLTGAFSPDIAKVEIHLSFVENDVAKMEQQKSVSIEPGATLKFEHGGYHLMLMGLTEALKEGDSIDIILNTSNGDMLIEMPVKKMSSSMGSMNNDVKNGSEMNMDKSMEKDDVQKLDNSETENQVEPVQDAKKDGDKHTDSTKVVH